jgi:hypothetical protein
MSGAFLVDGIFLDRITGLTEWLLIVSLQVDALGRKYI